MKNARRSVHIEYTSLLNQNLDSDMKILWKSFVFKITVLHIKIKQNQRFQRKMNKKRKPDRTHRVHIAFEPKFRFRYENIVEIICFYCFAYKN